MREKAVARRPVCRHIKQINRRVIMKKRLVSAVMAVVLSAAMLVGCGGSSGAQQAAGAAEEKTEETAEAEAPQNGGETVKIICGYGAGGTADLVARTYAKTANTLQSDYNFVVGIRLRTLLQT